MPTRFTTASQPAVSFARVCGSCTSASTTSTVGRRIRCLARSRRRVGPTTKCSSSTSWRTRCRPTKPLPPMTRMRLMVPPGKAASLTAKRALQGARPMLPEKSLLNDGFVAYCRHAFRGAARQDDAQARLQRRRLGPEDGGVVDGVRHHLLDVVARLAERNGLDEDRAFDRSSAAPQARARGPGVVRGRSQNGAAIELIEDVLEVIRAERRIEIRFVQPRRGEVLHAHSLRHPLRRRAHHLHEARRAGGGFCAGDETAFLAHHTQHPGLLEIARARFFGEHFAIGRKVAHRKIMGEYRSVRSADGPVPGFVAACELRRREQRPIVHAADGPEPLPGRLGPHVQAIERERTREPGYRRDLGDLAFGGQRSPGRNPQAHAELLGGEAPVETVFPGDALEIAFGFQRAAELALGPAVPVDPHRIVLRERRHPVDRAPDLGPPVRPHRNPRTPNQSSASGTCRSAPFMASISQTYLRSSTGKASLRPPPQNPAAARASVSATKVRAAMTSSRSVTLARSTCGFLRNLTGARMTAPSRFASMASPRGRNSMVRLAALMSPAPTSTRNRSHASREPS